MSQWQAMSTPHQRKYQNSVDSILRDQPASSSRKSISFLGFGGTSQRICYVSSIEAYLADIDERD